MKKFKRIYVEITNRCNLNCSFCSTDSRPKKEMTEEEFEQILKKINSYTDYLYLHVKGEPLLHTKLDKILSLTKRYNKKVCITTNGTHMKDKIDILKKYDNIYQINISLHSENNRDNYFENIYDSIKDLNCYISYRFWTLEEGKMDEPTKKIYNKIKEVYNKKELTDGIKLDNKVYLSLDNKFVWPSLNNNYVNEIGYCLGGKSQLAILNDGTIVVCCLDSLGISNLGNIFTDNVSEILTSDKYLNIIKEFQNQRCYLDICKHCSYKERFNKNK